MNKLNIPLLYDVSSTVEATSGKPINRLWDGSFTDEAQFNNSNSAFTITLTTYSNSPHTISQAKLWSNSIASNIPTDVTVKLYSNNVLFESVNLSSFSFGIEGNEFNFSNNSKPISKVELVLNSFQNSFFVLLEEFELYGRNLTPDFEFNDSVLTTHAWNSSRYDGRQLSSNKINEYTAGDTTWAHTPVVSNYTRNIYIGSRVIGMREPGLGVDNDDPTLTPFPGFSYVTVDDYITVNADDSVTRRSIRGGRGSGDDLNAKKGFYQAWYQDFPIGTKATIKPLDKKLAQSLQQRYDIFNNNGQLQKTLLVTRAEATDTYDSGSYYAASYTTESRIFDYCSGSGNPQGEGDIGAEYSIYNQMLIINKFFTGSLIANQEAGGEVSAPDASGGVS